MRAGRAAGLRLLAARGRTSRERLGPVRLMLSGSAPLSAELIEQFTDAHRHPGPPGLRPHRGRRRSSPPPCAAHELQPGSVGAALPGIEIRLRRRGRPGARGRRPRRDLDPRRQPVQRLLARRRRRPGRRRLVGAPATSASSTPTGDLFLVDRLKELVIVSGLQRLPGRGRGRHPRGRRRRRGGGDRRRGRRAPARRSSPTSTRAGGASADAVADAVREHCARAPGPVQAAVADRGRRRAAAHGHRQGAEGPAARHRAPASRWGCWSEPVTRRASRSTAARAATSATTPARSSSRSAPSWASRTTRSPSPTTPTSSAASARRSR